ncbi:hypothetical protein BU26DRAFT_415517 [Trematosphaeria pertusa]|uniref:Phytocyanin domain-containing protein n=1 Tax=Trematosphaeria pertusa TaxID=390896 RepID=A0A6A6J126_9PLEO|nr:uncharacterized protein BU26DRAFT_415517 [Trematosphaeria pertusa]KAF2256545.1 hypothetical protein BU26DRAFT_415517 [Trematosphaeria pertusa]
MHSLSPLLFAALTAAKVYTIDVGESGLHLSPQTISPAIGDTVIFHLYPRHNVVQTSFSSPCVPSTGNGFFSGPFDNTDNGEKKFVVNVTTTSPVWYYCAVPTHCQKGMVGGWNVPEEGNTIEAFASAAEGVDTSEAPSSMRGGQLLDDEQIMSLTATGSSSPSTTASGR